MSTLVENAPLSQIRENPVALRNVDTKSESYLEMADSVRTHGILTPPNAVIRMDEEVGEEYYLLVDGLHRFTAAKDAGLESIPLHILDLKEEDILVAQIVANAQKVETKPSEYKEQIIRLMGHYEGITEGELAHKLGKSTSWIRGRLSLLKIKDENINELINVGKISLSKAYALAKLPEDEQNTWVDKAITMDQAEFCSAVAVRGKEILDAKRKGVAAKPAEFAPTPRLRYLKEISEEANTGHAGASLGVADLQSFITGVKWACKMDDASIEEQRAKWDAAAKAKADRKAAKQAERDAKKAAKAAEALEEYEAKMDAKDEAAAATEPEGTPVV